jgi:uncharacterized membrane protein
VRRLQLFLQAVALLGATLAGYLWWLRQSQAIHPGCHAGGDCSYLWFGAWGTWFGLPVSALALVPYASVLAGIWLSRRTNVAETGLKLLAAVAVFLLVMVGWFMVLQAVVIGQWCRLCLISHFLSTMTAGLVFFWLKKNGQQHPASGPWFHGRAGLVGAIAGLIAIAGHSLSGHQATDLQFKPLPVTTPLQRVNRDTIRIFEREANLRRDALILSGQETAPVVVVILSDYTCNECRRLSGQMRHLLASDPDRYLEVVLPAPLDATCNPAVIRGRPAEGQACELAKIACVVGSLSPAEFPEFHAWLMRGAQPPSLDMARQRAQALLPSGRQLTEELSRPENLRPLALGLEVFKTNLTINRLDGLPLVMTTESMFMGAPENLDVWIKFLNPTNPDNR